LFLYYVGNFLLTILYMLTTLLIIYLIYRHNRGQLGHRSIIGKNKNMQHCQPKLYYLVIYFLEFGDLLYRLLIKFANNVIEISDGLYIAFWDLDDLILLLHNIRDWQ
jgi:hypothetical protein